ncbi:MAG: hypothetical protein GF317_17525 [Candidatus Lokiarchaeota archaeon]|nr:hypothetical protein [Candidatus Lokiarchaeota archaeon]MBD3201321.1 hypothetical protein [Candidatus Lokiarchaeota archaeon]
MYLIDLDIRGWQIFHKLNITELHDRMIVASYHFYKAKAIITRDSEIINEVACIWD